MTLGNAADFYVSVTGDDGANGSVSSPWRSLQHAVDEVAAGDSVVVKAGTYNGFKTKSSGTQLAPITLKTFNDDIVVLDSPSDDSWHGSIVEVEGTDWWIVDGLEVTGSAIRAGIDIRLSNHIEIKNCFTHDNYRWGIFTSFSDYLVIENNECCNSVSEHGIYVSNSSDFCVIRYNDVHHNNVSGIQLNADPSMGGDGISSSCVISHNYIYNNGENGGAAVNLASVRDSIVANNLIFANSATGIAGWDDGQGEQWGCKNNHILNNTVYQPVSSRWAIGLIHGSSGNVVKNNILIHEDLLRGSLEIDSSSLVALASDYNIVNRVSVDERVMILSDWQSEYLQDSSSVDAVAGTIFVRPGENFHLVKTSEAIDAGVDFVEVVDDIEGNSRPSGKNYDMGAYEYKQQSCYIAPILWLLL